MLWSASICCIEASCCIITPFPAAPAADRAARGFSGFIGFSADIGFAEASESGGQLPSFISPNGAPNPAIPL